MKQVLVVLAIALVIEFFDKEEPPKLESDIIFSKLSENL